MCWNWRFKTCAADKSAVTAWCYHVNKISEECFQHLVESMPQRIKAESKTAAARWAPKHMSLDITELGNLYNFKTLCSIRVISCHCSLWRLVWTKGNLEKHWQWEQMVRAINNRKWLHWKHNWIRSQHHSPA